MLARTTYIFLLIVLLFRTINATITTIMISATTLPGIAKTSNISSGSGTVAVNVAVWSADVIGGTDVDFDMKSNVTFGLTVESTSMDGELIFRRCDYYQSPESAWKTFTKRTVLDISYGILLSIQTVHLYKWCRRHYIEHITPFPVSVSYVQIDTIIHICSFFSVINIQFGNLKMFSSV